VTNIFFSLKLIVNKIFSYNEHIKYVLKQMRTKNNEYWCEIEKGIQCVFDCTSFWHI